MAQHLPILKKNGSRSALVPLSDAIGQRMKNYNAAHG